MKGCMYSFKKDTRLIIIIIIITSNYIAPISLILLGALQCYILGDLNGLLNAVYKHE